MFRLAVLVKGIDGAVELVAAVVLLLAGAQVPRLVADVVTHDLLGPSDGTLARHLVAGTAEFASGDQPLVVAYLALHAVLKLGLVVALLRRWHAAYPVAMVVLAIFVAAELARAVATGSVVLPVLAAFDLAVLALVWREYRGLRRGAPS